MAPGVPVSLRWSLCLQKPRAVAHERLAGHYDLPADGRDERPALPVLAHRHEHGQRFVRKE
eukprot:1469128-Prorocentrum_lima.AAC.1